MRNLDHRAAGRSALLATLFVGAFVSATVSGAARAPKAAPPLLPIGNVVEAEEGILTECAIIADDTASGGQFVLMLDAGSVSLTLEPYDPTAPQDLVIAYRSRFQDRFLDVFVDDDYFGSYLCAQTLDDEWDTLTIAWGVEGWLASVVRFVESGADLSGFEIDLAGLCTSEGQDCSGCTVAPMSETIFNSNKKKLVLPPVPGAGKYVTSILRNVSMNTATVEFIYLNASGGSCELQATEAQEPCGEKECKEKKACSLFFRITFKAHDYCRPPFTDTVETVTKPDGKVVECSRSHHSYTLDSTVEVSCGTAENVTYKLENGSVIQPLSCNKCEEN